MKSKMHLKLLMSLNSKSNFKVNGNYVDPTLEAQNMHKEVEYVIHKEFSKKEMIKLMVERFGLDEINLMFQGIKPFWPFNKIGEHEYAFVDA